MKRSAIVLLLLALLAILYSRGAAATTASPTTDSPTTAAPTTTTTALAVTTTTTSAAAGSYEFEVNGLLNVLLLRDTSHTLQTYSKLPKAQRQVLQAKIVTLMATSLGIATERLELRRVVSGSVVFLVAFAGNYTEFLTVGNKYEAALTDANSPMNNAIKTDPDLSKLQIDTAYKAYAVAKVSSTGTITIDSLGITSSRTEFENASTMISSAVPLSATVAGGAAVLAMLASV